MSFYSQSTNCASLARLSSTSLVQQTNAPSVRYNGVSKEQSSVAPLVRLSSVLSVRQYFNKMFLILAAIVAMSANVACEKKGTFSFKDPKVTPQEQPGTPATGETPDTEVEGGISSGGGGTLPANPISVFKVYEIVKDAKAALRMFYRMENETAEDNDVLYGMDKFVVGPRNLVTILEETEVEVLQDKPCKDKNGNEVDASIVASKPNAICLSAFRVAPKLIEERAHIEIIALITHELCHLLGANEKEAVEVQKYTAINFEKVFFENFGNQLWDLRDKYSALVSSLNQIIEFADKEDWTATNEALDKFYLNSYQVFDQVFTWKYPFSIYGYKQFHYNTIQLFRLNLINEYLQTIIPPHAGQAFYIEEYQKIFGDKKVLTIKEATSHSSGSWYQKCKYCDTETVTKIESKEELIKQLQAQKEYYNEQSDFVWALSFGNALPVMNGPWNAGVENPWKVYLGSYSAKLISCSNSEGTDVGNFANDIIGIDLTPGSLIKSDIIATVRYSNGSFTEGFSDNGVEVLGGASVKVFAQGNSVFRTAELGDKWDFHSTLDWRMKTSEFKSENGKLIYIRKMEFQDYNHYVPVNSWDQCSFELTHI